MKNKITPTDLFLAVLTLMLISVSFYQTWLGLQQIFGTSSFVISLVLSLLLLFLLWQLRKSKMSGLGTRGLVLIYFFIASFCFIANFNALYTRFMRTDIFTTELRDLNDRFSDLETNVESKLNYSVADAQTRQAIRSELNLLKIQIMDPRNRGIGPEARQIIGRIEKLIGKKITPLTPIDETPSGYADLADRMEEQIVQMVYNLTPEEKNLMSDINNATLKWNKDIQNLLLKSHQEIDEMAQGQIDKAISEYNKLGNRAHAILGEDKFKFEMAHSNTQEVGKIGFAFNHAISHFGMYQFVVLMGCVLLDFGIMIIILLVPSENVNNGGRGSVFGSTGKTLIPRN
jgi:multisubunit Na+/H+ antiporter MnhE subunit